MQWAGPTLSYNLHPCPSVTVMLQCSSCAMGWKYKVHCSCMQLPTLSYNHHPCLIVTVMLQSSSCAMDWKYKVYCSFMQLPTLPYKHHPCPSVPSECDAAMQFLCNGLDPLCRTISTHVQVCHQSVMLQCSSCAMGWRRTLQ